MIEKERMKQFLNKSIRIVYLDSNKPLSAMGILKDVTNYDIALETNWNVLIIPLDAIQKIKISKIELDSHD
jgi:hypothetical protein